MIELLFPLQDHGVLITEYFRNRVGVLRQVASSCATCTSPCLLPEVLRGAGQE